MSAGKHNPVDVVPSVVLGIVLLALWEAVVRVFHVSNYVIPAPSEIGVSLYENAGTLDERPAFLRSLDRGLVAGFGSAFRAEFCTRSQLMLAVGAAWLFL